MSETEKMGLVEWLEVHRHSRVVYLKLRPDDVAMYKIQPGDRILVELVALKREPRGEAGEKRG